MFCRSPEVTERLPVRSAPAPVSPEGLELEVLYEFDRLADWFEINRTAAPKRKSCAPWLQVRSSPRLCTGMMRTVPVEVPYGVSGPRNHSYGLVSTPVV